MVEFQTGGQKFAPQDQVLAVQAQVYYGKDAQRILQQGVMPVCEQMLSKMNRL
jgi:hypothetical protein